MTGGGENRLWVTLTHDCPLECGYCYIRGERQSGAITREIAGRAVVEYLSENTTFMDSGFTLSFIGGEPFQETDLMESIYLDFLSYTESRNHPWFSNHRIAITTCGIYKDISAVRRFLNLYGDNISITLSLDGNRSVHDFNRRYPDSSGTYESVIQALPMFRESDAELSVNVVISPSQAEFSFDSIRHIWNLGLTISQVSPALGTNWDDNSCAALEYQMILLADYLVDNNLDSDRRFGLPFFIDSCVGFFAPGVEPAVECSAGSNLLAVDIDGSYYPCYKMLPMMNNGPSRRIGDVSRGYDLNSIRPFLTYSVDPLRSAQCRECRVNRGCGLCPALNLKESLSGSIFDDSHEACQVHKAMARANEYYRNRLCKQRAAG